MNDRGWDLKRLGVGGWVGGFGLSFGQMVGGVVSDVLSSTLWTMLMTMSKGDDYVLLDVVARY